MTYLVLYFWFISQISQIKALMTFRINEQRQINCPYFLAFEFYNYN